MESFNALHIFKLIKKQIMKFHKIHFSLLMIFMQFCFSQQNGKAFYIVKSAKSIDKSLDSTHSESNLKNPFGSIDKTLSELRFILLFNNDVAVYQEDKQLEVDNKNDLERKLAKVYAGYSGATYYDLNNNKLTTKIDQSGSIFLVERSLTHYDWKLSKEMIRINNLTCYKATTLLQLEGRRGSIEVPVTAWYTTDINIPVGPNGFSGLPGLIVQIQKGDYVTTLSKIEFINNKINIDIPNKGKRMTQEAFDSLMKEMSSNRSKYY